MARAKIKIRPAQAGSYQAPVDYEGMDKAMISTLTKGNVRKIGGQMPAQSSLWSELKGRLGFAHTPDVEAGFKVRGRRAYKGY